MEKRFVRELVRLSANGRKILVAVSGGIDSVVLSHLLKGAEQHAELVHANFQLRGEASDQDEAFVRALGNSLDMKVHVKRFETNNYAIDEHLSIQMAARELRYAWFHEVLASTGADLIATAHHLNDSLETTLINLSRGSGLSGLAGIPAKNDKIVRPLLVFQKKEIEVYAAAQTLSWREDASNAGDDYQRNFIRHQIIPRLKEINPSLEATYEHTLARLGAASELAHLGIRALREQGVRQEGNKVIILKKLLHGLNHPAAVLYEFIKDFGFNLSQCDSIIIAGNGQPGKQFESPGFILVSDRDAFVISPEDEEVGEVIINEHQLLHHRGQSTIEIGIPTKFDQAPDPLIALFDSSKLTFPLVWRPWRHGDVFYPANFGHRKKISDLLIDRKISRNDKSSVTVITSGGEIIWVTGYRTDERFTASATTTTFLRMKLTKSGHEAGDILK